jgi:hypothetical protein
LSRVKISKISTFSYATIYLFYDKLHDKDFLYETNEIREIANEIDLRI